MSKQRVLIAVAIAAIAALPVLAEGSKPLYTVEIQSGATKAVDYSAMGGSAKIGFRGTVLAPNAAGDAKVQSKSGVMSIDASFKGLEPASKYGPQYMTYVLWAVSPEGRGNNLGELQVKDGKGKMQVTTRLQSFALIVTAEPYFAVGQIGNVVVLENTVDKSDAKYEVAVNYNHLPQNQYSINMDPADLKPMTMEKKVPPDIYQARNAVKLARAAGAEQFAADSFKKAADLLAQAEKNLSDKKGDKKAVAPLSRHAVQQAEDSRQLAIRKQAEEKVAADKRAAEEKSAAEKRAIEERAAADKKRMEGQVAAAQQTAASETSQRQAAEQEAQRANAAAAQSEREKAMMRERLKEQLNAVMKTTDSARGLIVSMSGLLFETGKATLLPPVRESLARVAGILLGHPGLTLEIEGHTDNTGSDELNQKLSEERAAAVKDYLKSQGVPDSTIVSRGFGKNNPVATNDTKDGRAQNRRVEIVVSGAAIGGETAAR